MSFIRTFIAVEATSEIRSRAVDLIDHLKVAGATVKWVQPSHLHLTLKFLGDVADAKIPGVCQAVLDAAVGLKPFSIECRGAGAFPALERPRTVWLGLGVGQEPCASLQAAIEERLEKLGFCKEARRFRGHLTLGRVRGGGPTARQLGQLIGQNVDFEAGKMTVSQVVVFSSELSRSGPTYTTLSRAKLGSSSA